MFTNLKKRSEGFTIIEVLIVLAIAGLIMLVVFLAVPALQRNSQNTAKRDKVAKVLGAMQENISNNNGSMPAVSGDATTIETLANLDAQTNVRIVDGEGNVVAPSIDEIQIVKGVKCTPGAASATAAAPTVANYTDMSEPASGRDYVAFFLVAATGGNSTTQCQGS